MRNTNNGSTLDRPKTNEMDVIASILEQIKSLDNPDLIRGIKDGVNATYKELTSLNPQATSIKARINRTATNIRKALFDLETMLPAETVSRMKNEYLKDSLIFNDAGDVIIVDPTRLEDEKAYIAERNARSNPRPNKRKKR